MGLQEFVQDSEKIMPREAKTNLFRVYFRAVGSNKVRSEVMTEDQLEKEYEKGLDITKVVDLDKYEK